MTSKCFPISAIVATADRAESFGRTLRSLASQTVQPAEIVIVDASADAATRLCCDDKGSELASHLRWIESRDRGAAPQRNLGLQAATNSVVWFFDDDIHFEAGCVEHLWVALNSDPKMGGVTAMISNQQYAAPGAISRLIFRILRGQEEPSYAGKVIGPAVNLLPESGSDLPEIVPMEWLNTTCTMYRREALPAPVFDEFFTGYSLMEDVALSLRVAKRGWKLANARLARIVHDSQPGPHKADVQALAAMELRNRKYVMTEILGRNRPADYLRLGLWECFSVLSSTTSARGLRELPHSICGKAQAMFGSSPP